MLLPAIIAALVVFYFLQQRLSYHRRKTAALKKWIALEKFPEGQKVADISVPINLANPFGIVQFFVFLNKTKGTHFVDFVNENFNKFGYILQTKTFGRANIITCDPELIKTVLATNFKDWSIGIRRKAMFPVLGNAIFSVEGDQWTHSRAMLRPQFTRDSISNVDDLECHVSRLVSVFRGYQGNSFDCQKYFFQFTLDSASDFLFGESTLSLATASPDNLLTQQGENADSFAQAFRVAFTFTAIRLRLQQFYWLLTPSNKKYKGSIDRVHRLVDGYVDRAFQEKNDTEKNNRYIISNQLVKVCDDKKYIRDQLLGILLAGRNTTAAVLAWIMYEAGRRPEIWQKLRQEVADMFPGGTVTSEELRKCTYVRAVINEALRLYPSVPMNQRVAVTDTFLPTGGGPDKTLPLFCPKGTKLAYSVFALHMRQDFYGKDTDVFRPERWNEGVGKGWQYLPFNGGPRICLGQQFALMEASYTLVRLVQEFQTVELDMEVVDPPPKMSSFSMVHKDGVSIRLK